MTKPDMDQLALTLADLAFIEVVGSDAERVRAAIWAYLWAQQNTREQFGMEVCPSLNELREALTAATWRLRS